MVPFTGKKMLRGIRRREGKGLSLTSCQDDRSYAVRISRMTGHVDSTLLVLLILAGTDHTYSLVPAAMLKEPASLNLKTESVERPASFP
jgi:hypothetical protein